MKKIPCTVEILTLNSAATLARCLASVKDFSDIIVLDGNSTDETRTIARQFGARVVSQSSSPEPNYHINDFSVVRNRGIVAAQEKWFLFIDSDEYLSDGAVEEIRSIIVNGGKQSASVYRIPRKYVIGGTVIGRSSMYPNYQVRFFHLDAVYEFIKPIHERINIKDGMYVGTLEHPVLVPFEDKLQIIAKWKRYAEHEVTKRPVSRVRLVPYTLRNLLEFLKYILKYFRTFLLGRGPRMPFFYEWHNAIYHTRLISCAWRVAFKKS